MKRKGTRILCLIIAFAFSITLMSGCGNQNTASQDESSQVGSSSTQTTSNPDDSSAMKPIEFTYFIPDSSMKIPPADAPILQQVYEKTKVKINFVIPPADSQEKLNIMLAAADYPDIIEFPNFVTMDKYIKAGYLVALDDLLNQYGPDLKTNLGKIMNRLKSEADGKIYYLPSRYRVDGVEMFPETSLTFSIRSGYLEKKGWYKPQTLGDIENLLKEIKAQDPNTIPLSFALGGGEVRNLLMALLKVGLGSSGLTYNESGELILRDDDTLGYSYKNENVRNFFMWLNKLYTEGLLDKESPVLTSDALNTKCSAGKVASVIGDYWGAPNEANKYFESKNNNDQFYYFYPKANENVKKVTYAPYSLAYSFGNAITNKCKDPVRAMQFINYLNTEDGFNAMHGVTNFDGEDKEGYDFYVDKNQGNAIFPTKWFSEQLTKDENFGASRGFMSLLGLGFSMSNLPGGKYDYIKVEEDVGAWDSDAIKRIKQGLGVKGTDYFPMMRDMSIDVTNITGLPLETQSDEGVIKGKIDDYISKAVPKLIVSKTEADFTKGYNDMLSHLDELGLEKYLTKMNELYKSRKNLWK